MNHTIDLGFCRAHATSVISGLDALFSLSICGWDVLRCLGNQRAAPDLEDIPGHNLKHSTSSMDVIIS